MMFRNCLRLLAYLPSLAQALGATDSIQDVDPTQSGYLSNHNIHPATVGSSAFGQLWKNQYNAKEVWYARPLVFTPASGKQLVFLASNMNNIRTLDAVNGTLINQRLLQPPFLQSDIGCGDIPNYIGVTGTPIIDPDTETAYFFSKGYISGTASGGVPNGIYKFYAVDINTLLDQPGFPVLIDGHFADNDHTRYFLGGTILQRTALTQLNGVVVGGFGGHCDLFNYTGMLVSVSKTPGVGVASIYAMEASPGAPSPQMLDIMNQNGGKAGIWQSGMGIATDGSRIFIATGNGQGHANGDVPMSGRLPLSTLDEVVANFQVSSTGTMDLTDWFEPYEYVNMDAGDRDLGASGVTLLDGSVFNGIGVSQIAVTIGKNGKAYILDADSLGGFKQGPGGIDNVLQTLNVGTAVFGGVGSYPLEGGYIYFTPTGAPTFCYKIGFDNFGKPLFTLVGQTATSSAGTVGTGPATVTSFQGEPGTGIVWITDTQLGLRAFNAVPENGVLVPIALGATPGLSKFQRPVFGDGRLYISDSKGGFYCLGSPVALPLQCNQPVDFGSVTIGLNETVAISCKALIPIKKIIGCTTADPNFQCSNESLPQGALTQGQNFSFPVTWDLTQHSLNDKQNASYGKVMPGVESTVLELFTINGVSRYSTALPVSLLGTTVSSNPFLSISPEEVDFGGIVVGSADQASGLSGSFIVANIGQQNLVFQGFAYNNATESNTFDNLTTASDGSTIVGDYFTSSAFPSVGQVLTPSQSITIPLLFNSNTTGSFSSLLTIWSNGGMSDLLLVGSASTAAIANISVSTIEGGWDYSEPVSMAFGNVLAGTTANESIRICNSGGSPLTITKSKPPTQIELTAKSPDTDLHEGQFIQVNSCALGLVIIPAAFEGPNRPSHNVSDVWTLNTDGLNNQGQPFGVHEVAIFATIVTQQIGILLPDGTARFQYLGCYADGNGRNLATQLSYTAAQHAANENGQCQKDCFAAGYIFSGTQYHDECWCGSMPPLAHNLTPESANKCSFSCSGDTTQACGGVGTYESIYYDALKYSPPLPSTSANSTLATSQSSAPLMPSGSTLSINTTLVASSSGTPKLPTTTTTTSTSSGVSASSNLTTTPNPSSEYTLSTSPTSAISSSIGPKATTTTPLTSSVTLPVPTAPSTGGYAYTGCFAEPPTGRALSDAIFADDTMSVEECLTYCGGKYNYFGLEYGRECYCGYVLATGTTRAPEGDCNIPCVENSNELCGSRLRLSLYTAVAPIPPPLSPSAVPSVGPYTLLGCYTESTTGRALASSSITNGTNMSNEFCANFCSAFSMFGTEYGSECYCGSSLSAGSVLAPSTDCNFVCPGSKLEFCGAGKRLNLYSIVSASRLVTRDISNSVSSTRM